MLGCNWVFDWELIHAFYLNTPSNTFDQVLIFFGYILWEKIIVALAW